MFKKIILFCFSIAAGALIIISGFLWVSPRNTQVLEIILPKSLFSLENAPANSLAGEIASISGKVAWQSRVAPVAILIDSPTKLQQGEEVDSYNNGNAMVSFSKVGTIAIFSNTQINFIQTLFQDFVISQKQGSADYSKTGENPLSVVALDLLVNINSGESSIFVNKDTSTVTVNVKIGYATAAFNDRDDNTQVIPLKAGQQYIFDDNTKTGLIKTL
jgi:hypothetical protein